MVVQGLDNGVARTPPMGWSTWNTFRFDVSSSLIIKSADAMISSGLRNAGYEYVLIDDGWPMCAEYNHRDGHCLVPYPRDSQGRIQVNTTKFPDGMAVLADYIHSKGMKLGIYTAVSETTCGGFTGSLHHEKIDAQTFADWGMDFVKMDTCGKGPYGCGVHDGCMQNSTAAMRDGLNATGRPIVFYIDAGNPTSSQRTYNPYQYHVRPEAMVKVASIPSQLVWEWGPSTANMWKHWFDIGDNWASTIDNLHNMARLEMYQTPGAFNTPDMLTVGQGAMTETQYRSQFFLWAVLGSPLILGNDVRSMDNFTIELLTSSEVLAVNQDKDCVQASLAHFEGATEVWVKPLSSRNFAAVLFNNGPEPANVTLEISSNYQGNGDFYPATFPSAHLRDIYAQKDLGVYTDGYTALVQGYDAMILLVIPDLL